MRKTSLIVQSAAATYQVRSGHQPQDRQGPRPDDPAVAPAAGGSGDRVIDRRAFIGTLTGGLLAAPLAAMAQQPAKVHQILYLGYGSLAEAADPPSAPTKLLRAIRHCAD